MPKGIPVATVAIDGAENAAYLAAAQILSLSDQTIADKLAEMKKRHDSRGFEKGRSDSG